MIHYNANASVIYTDAEGKKTDTFVIFDTNTTTGLTHINHENLRVPAEKLELHSTTIGAYHLPIADAFSFELIGKLKDKYAELDGQPKEKTTKTAPKEMYVLADAS
jgi:hypothetical protein